MLNKKSNIAVSTWISNTLNYSNSDWYIAVFKIEGTYKDDYGISRQVLNQSNLSTFYKSVDWCITTSRRNINCKSMKFIPFIGGDRDEHVAIHIHAFIEIPSHKYKWPLHDSLKRNWHIYASRAFKLNVNDDLWLNILDKSLIENHGNYCMRYEGKTFLNGTEKVLFQLKSCLL